MEILLDGLAAFIGRFLGASLSPEIWIAAAIVIIAGRTISRFVAATALCALILMALWVGFVIPRLRAIGFISSLSVADYFVHYLFLFITIGAWGMLGRFIKSKFQKRKLFDSPLSSSETIQ